MKASRFVKAFESDVDYWERTLSHILEVIEMIQTVQRQWMYLEVRPRQRCAMPKKSCDFTHAVMRLENCEIRIPTLWGTCNARVLGHIYSTVAPW